MRLPKNKECRQGKAFLWLPGTYPDSCVVTHKENDLVSKVKGRININALSLLLVFWWPAQHSYQLGVFNLNQPVPGASFPGNTCFVDLSSLLGVWVAPKMKNSEEIKHFLLPTIKRPRVISGRVGSNRYLVPPLVFQRLFQVGLSLIWIAWSTLFNGKGIKWKHGLAHIHWFSEVCVAFVSIRCNSAVSPGLPKGNTSFAWVFSWLGSPKIGYGDRIKHFWQPPPLSLDSCVGLVSNPAWLKVW